MEEQKQWRLNPMVAFFLIGFMMILLFAGIYFLGAYYSCEAGHGVLYMGWPIHHICIAGDVPDCTISPSIINYTRNHEWPNGTTP